MLHTIWRGASLRAWMAIAMAIAVLPLALSAFGGYLLLHHGVIVALQDVSVRQREEIDPTQQVRLLILEAGTPLDTFIDEAHERHSTAYQALQREIDSTLAALRVRMEPDTDTALYPLILRASAEWRAADSTAAAIFATPRAPGDREGLALMDTFHRRADRAVATLGLVNEALAKDLRDDHDTVLRDVERSRWFALGAGAISLVAIVVGVVLIGHLMSASVERLVSGAELFAAGNRDHRIDVQVPPELQRVAEEFNRMIGRIHDSEGALAEQARRDPLTTLLNRRAFDEGMTEAFARRHRLGERFALLLLDLDRFKQINDRHGHAGGDDVLRATARRLHAELRPFDRLYRIGGEEFAAILPGTDLATARTVAERLRATMASHPVPAGENSIEVTVSIGGAVPRDTSDTDAILAAADAALYRAKAAGRDRVVMDGEE